VITADSQATTANGENYGRFQGFYWPTVIGSALLAALVPWYFGFADVDLRPALRILLSGGVAAVLLMQWHSETGGLFLRAIAHLLCVVLLAATWYALDTFNVAGFIILFALPVFASALVADGWLAYIVAAVAIASTTIAAFFSSPPLRWYIEQLPVYPGWLPELDPTRVESFWIATSLDGRQQFVFLVTFGITMLAVALLGTTATQPLKRLKSRLRTATRTARENEVIAKTLLEEMQTLDAFVSPSAGRILSSSAAFERSFGASSGQERDIFETLDPAYPETLMQLIGARDGGTALRQICRPGDQHRVFDIDTQPVEIDGERVVRVRIGVTAGNDLAVAALEHFGLALLILGSDHRVLFSNPAFRDVFPGATLDAPADQSLGDCHGLPAFWWNIAPSSQSRLRFEASSRHYLATVALAGIQADLALTLIQLQVEGEP
jgi:hypothetical protein